MDYLTNLIKRYIDKHTIYPIIECNPDHDVIELNERELNILDIFYDCYKIHFWEREYVKSLEYTISIPFMFPNGVTKIPRLNQNKLEFINCTIIGNYNYNNNEFTWGGFHAKNIMLNKIGFTDNNIFKYNKYKNVNLQTADNLAISFRALWFYYQMEYTLDGNKMNTYNFVKFDNEIDNNLIVTYCLADFGFNNDLTNNDIICPYSILKLLTNGF